MLSKIFIYNFIVFDKVEIDLSPGFNAISGESGSGKSLIFTAIAFALGSSKKKNFQKEADKEAIVILEFDIGSYSFIKDILSSQHLDLAGNSLTIKKVLTINSKIKYYINDIPVTNQLAENIASHLAQSLEYGNSALSGNSNEIIALLDAQIRGNLPFEVKAKYQEYQKAKQSLLDAEQNAKTLEQEKSFIEFSINEIEKVSPQKGEEDILVNKKKTLANSKQISDLVDKAKKSLAGQTIENLWLCHRNLSKLNEIMENSDFLQLQQEIESSAIIADEVAKALNDKSLTNFDYENLEDIDNRLYAIRSLARKFFTDPDGLEEVLNNFKAKLQSSESQEQNLANLNNECTILLKQYIDLAKNLSYERLQVAKDLSMRVNAQLLDLNMSDSKITINLSSNPSLVKSSGIDEASLSINHCGNEIGKLANVASGGEKSRITLAFRIATCQNKKDQFNPILLFDEVDSGVGGFIARKVGEKLKNLGASQQILSITHNPQVVSLADNHLMVSKSKSINDSQQEKFISIVKILDELEREREVARMISGLDITDEAIKQAQKLLYSNIS